VTLRGSSGTQAASTEPETEPFPDGADVHEQLAPTSPLVARLRVSAKDQYSVRAVVVIDGLKIAGSK